jgi:ribosomal protein S18 acetylase RimI-like enzyme
MKSAIEWGQAEKQQVVDFLSHVFRNHEFVSQESISEIFHQSVYLDGETYMASFRDGQAIAVAAMIVEAIERDSIVYFSTCYCLEGQEERLEKMIESLEKKAKTWGATISKIGLRKENYSLKDRLLPGMAYSPTYRIVQMGKGVQGEVSLPEGFRDQIAGSDSLEKYVALHNEAFLKSPNSSELSLGEVRELLERQDQGEARLGFLVCRGEFVGTYLLSMEKEVLWADAITVNPKYQGQGWGKILMQNIENQAASMAKSLHLLVVDANVIAFRLYQKSEFLEEKVYSEWFEKSL